MRPCRYMVGQQGTERDQLLSSAEWCDGRRKDLLSAAVHLDKSLRGMGKEEDPQGDFCP